MKIALIRTLIFLIGILLFTMIIQSCAVQPKAWSPSATPQLEGVLKENDLLKNIEKIDIGSWYGPEDIATDSLGNLYCGVHISKTDFTSGRILKITPEGEITTFCNTNSWITGLHFDKAGNLIACDTKRGLISIDSKGKITILADEDENGNKFLIPNDIDIADDGMIYFSNTSSQYNFSTENARKIILEIKPDGGLYQYNPNTKSVTTLIDHSFFGNGVAVSQDNDFVLMVDLAKYRIVKYHLKGIKKGQVETFMDNLPGFPNGISRRKDGSFWLGFTTIRDNSLDKIHPNPLLKKLVYALPNRMQPQQKKFGMMMHISNQGEILKTYYDTTGDFVSEVSSIEERNGYLYFGGDLIDHIVKFKLVE